MSTWLDATFWSATHLPRSSIASSVRWPDLKSKVPNLKQLWARHAENRFPYSESMRQTIEHVSTLTQEAQNNKNNHHKKKRRKPTFAHRPQLCRSVADLLKFVWSTKTWKVPPKNVWASHWDQRWETESALEKVSQSRVKATELQIDEEREMFTPHTPSRRPRDPNTSCFCFQHAPNC